MNALLWMGLAYAICQLLCSLGRRDDATTYFGAWQMIVLWTYFIAKG